MSRWNGNLSSQQKVLFSVVDKLDVETTREIIKKIAFDNPTVEQYLKNVFIDAGLVGSFVQVQNYGVKSVIINNTEVNNEVG